MVCKVSNEHFVNNYQELSSNENKYSMGPFSDLLLKPEGNSNWRHNPSNLPLYKPSTLYTPQGSPFPLKNQAKITNLPKNSNGPTVDGTSQTPNSMFMLNNKDILLIQEEHHKFITLQTQIYNPSNPDI